MRTTTRLLVHAAALFGPLCTWAQAEVEPNDGTATATPLTYNTPMTGSIGVCSPTNTTTDYFSFTAPQQGVMRLQFAMSNTGASNLTVTANIRNSSGTNLQTLTLSAGANNTVSITSVTQTCAGAGLYYVNINNPGGGTCMNYSLSYDIIAPVYANDAEPNQSTAAAVVANAGTSYDGHLDFEYDNNFDYFKLQAPTDGVMTVSFLAENASTSAGTMTVYLRNSSGTALQTWTANVGANSTPAGSTFTYTCSGTENVYYLEPYSPTNCGVSYRFDYSVAQPVYADDAEPNQSTAAAVVANAGTSYDGHLDFEYDNNFDYFKLQAPTDGVMTVSFLAENASTSAGTMTVYLRNSGGTALQTWTANVGANSTPAGSTFTYTCSGTENAYYLEPYSPTNCGVSYRFDYSVAQPVYADDAEPNQGTAAAVVIDLNAAAAEGRLSFDYDNNFDYFRVNHPGGQLVVNTLAESAGAAGTMTVYIRNSGNTAIVTNIAVPIGGNGTPAAGTTSTPGSVAAGVYYIETYAPSVCGVSYRLKCFDDDNDSVCNGSDLCANTPTGEGVNSNGCSCTQVIIDDGDACTLDECLNGEVTNTFQDADGDLTCDANDDCPNDPEKIVPGQCGCGVSDVDTDGDLTADCNDGCVNDPNKIAPGICGCGVADVATTYYADTDGDGFGDPAAPQAGFTCNVPSGFVSDNTDNCPSLFGRIGDSCDDGNAGTTGDVITPACVCTGSTVNCDDGDACTVDTFDGVQCVHTPIPTDDGDACTTDACVGGVVSHVPIDCNDGDACTTDACVAGNCVHTPVNCDDGDACTEDACVAGSCTHTPVNCDDGDACTTDACVAGNCVHTPVNCDDGDACTEDACVAGSCTHTPVNCDDGDACTTDACVAGSCVHTPINCDDGDACTVDACVAGSCTHTPVNCDDGDPCTTDSCDPVLGCQHIAPVTCDDGDACTTDTYDCDLGVCVYTPINCDDADACTNDACVAGVCEHTQIPTDDGDPCTTDACLAGVVSHTPIVCNDGDACTTDACVVGVCQYTPINCDDGDPNTIDACIGGSCIHTPIGGCSANDISLELVTDGNGAQTTWQIVNIGTSTVVCSGPSTPYGNNQAIVEHCCLADGCYELKVFDSFGDGMTAGGYRLKDQFGKRIIDNWNDGAFGTLSTIASNTGFCLDLGTDQLTSGSCDQETLSTTSVLVAMENTSVTAQYGITNATSGYQFQIFNPDGGYLRNIFQNMTTGAGTGAQKSRSLALNTIVSNPVPSSQLLNVRLRARVAGINYPYGSVCRLRIDPPPPCVSTQLDNDPLHAATYSCDVTGKMVGGSGNTNKIFAIPVTGATHYKFRLISGSYVRNIVVTETMLQFGLWSTNPLLCGTNTYSVVVAASMNGGLSYCPFGPTCTVEITNPGGAIPCTAPFTGGGHLNATTIAADASTLALWPNPNRGDQFHLQLSGIDPTVTQVTIDVHDLFGKRVLAETVPTGGGDLNHVMQLGSELASGMYTITVTAGPLITTERLVIQ